jgi:hypothetical protein
MKIKNLTIVWLTMLLSVCCSFSGAQAAGFIAMSDCLITSDIGKLSFESQDARMGDGSGVVGMAGHFNKDHTDTVCTGEYSNINEIRGLSEEEAYEKIFTVIVQVTKHAGSDSDKWLLHEVDREFRNYYGLPGNSFGPRQINGQTIIENLVAGGSYRWVSGNKVIVIEYHDSQMTRPEPIEVIQAYLAKHPSTMPSFTLGDLRSNAYKTTWIKDEMDRRLWLCDKWLYQLQLQKVQQADAFQAAVKSMNIFLDYREKYFGVKAADEKNMLAGYLNTNNGTKIKAKLDEYKSWWTANKDSAISL